MREGRLFEIIYQLLEKGQSTIPELAARLEVSERTIYRDMDVLSAAGIPIYMERGRNGGVRLMEGFVLSRELLSGQEKEELLSALQSLAAVGAYDAALLRKLSALFRIPSEGWYEVDFSRWGEQTQDNEKFELLKRAVICHRCVRIVYAGTGGEESARIVWPLKLSYRSRAWYLKAWCTQKADFRLFKLHRILKWELLEERFTPPASWNSDKEEKSVPPASGGQGKKHGAHPAIPPEATEVQAAEKTVLSEETQTGGNGHSQQPEWNPPFVRLRFPRGMAYRVFDEFEESQVTRGENGDFLVTAPMPVDDWVVSFLLSFGTQVEVIEPTYLRGLLAEKVMELYEKYKISDKT